MPFPHFGALELGIIALIVVMVFGVGKLPEIGGALGQSIRKFRREVFGKEDEAAAKASPEPNPVPARLRQAGNKPPGEAHLDSTRASQRHGH